MIILVIFILGLVLGSFVNALVWRLHEQSRRSNNAAIDLSILKGRSVCTSCHKRLEAIDLIPVLSWIYLKGKCRYCSKPISVQYPLVELTTGILFLISYLYWPTDLQGGQVALFICWLLLLVGFMALSIYDLRWYLLPNKIIYPVALLASIFAIISILLSDNLLAAAINTLFAVIIGGGIFYVLFQVSKGKWIGGGDVRLGWILGMIAGSAASSFLFIFIASILGTLVSLPLMMSHKLKSTNVIPFGPFLIAGLIITELFGLEILNWYQNTLLNL